MSLHPTIDLTIEVPAVDGGATARTGVVFKEAAKKKLPDLITSVQVGGPLVDKKYLQLPEPWARWGTNNLQPDTLLKYVQKCGLLGTCIDKLASYTSANGVFFYTNKNGIITEADPVWMKVWKAMNGERWLNRSAVDYWTFGNVFTKYIMDNQPKAKPMMIVPVSASYCRLKKQNKDTFISDTCYISNQWDTMMISTDPARDDVYTQQAQWLDVYMHNLQMEFMNLRQYMIGTDNYTPGNYYYHTLPWHADDVLKYVDILAALPEIEKNLFEKTASLKYQIKIDQNYIALRLGCKNAGDNKYLDLKPAAREAMIKTIREEMITYLTGTANQHTTVVTMKHYDEKSGNSFDYIEIVPLADLMDKSANIPNSQNASGKVMEGFGVDPVLLGSVMSDTKSRGGGSDKSEAMEALQAALQPHRFNLLFPARVFMQQLGMPDNIEIGIRDIGVNELMRMGMGKVA